MFYVRDFTRLNAPIIKRIHAARRSRIRRGRDRPADHAPEAKLETFRFPVELDAPSLVALGEASGFRHPDAILLRLWQYVAEHAGLSGFCAVPPDRFGPLVLSRPGHNVSRAEGRRVYEALLATGFALRHEPSSEHGAEPGAFTRAHGRDS